MSKHSNRQLVIKLATKQNWKCYYCGRTCKMSRIGYSYRKTPDYLATLEHLYSKYDIRRYCQKRDNDNTVMACRGCNDARCARENAMMTDMVDKTFKLIDLLNIGVTRFFNVKF